MRLDSWPAFQMYIKAAESPRRIRTTTLFFPVSKSLSISKSSIPKVIHLYLLPTSIKHKHLQTLKMYTITPTAKFLVLSPVLNGPDRKVEAPAHKFLVLSPTQTGPDSGVSSQASLSPTLTAQGRGRSDSYSSTSTNEL
ncbi:hypothetical protein ASPWEDRAFT_171785 [Aspergillus wentii DTO 134E9]|uniref:Uncharacterized protein n=1 Tax=Aspergillus wentii DTO 134E9 TaxID=1073089 RepID=A0A1L9RJ57_ASPWE|nr:uncharacterized protein ASPWEDRAFT_171785 [Aspergillus wentii DTO 134E9]OJJ34955.1 hypothetical protein ASPWEDRAFT_171785 [Aspergillus wentii DTO 134E9]